jgi:hypothetical protein
MVGYEERRAAEARRGRVLSGLRHDGPWPERHQQNLDRLPIAIVTLSARSNRLSDLKPLIPTLQEALPHLKAGELRSLKADG